MATDPGGEIQRLHREAPLTDVHAHPSLKAYLFRRNLWRHYWSGSFLNPFSSRTDFQRLSKGGVGVVVAAHYLPERRLAECFWIRAAAFLLIPAYPKLMHGSRFERLLEMVEAMEREVGRRPDRTEVARSYADLARIQAAGKMAVVHAVEGAHVLEGDLGRLDTLAQRGVAMLTLTHFYPNQVASQVDAIPKDLILRRICNLDLQPGSGPPLTEFGKEVVRRCVELGIVVDVTHCTPEARGAVFQEVSCARPVVASHVGAQALRPTPYNLADEEIEEIARGGGAVGVIFMPYWLSPGEEKTGLASIWATLEHIRDVTGSWEHAMLGTDFDGFTDPPDDVPDASHLGAVTQMMIDRGLPEVEIKRILGGNALRVLRSGWR